MKTTIDIDRDDLFEYVKLSFKLPKLVRGAITCKIIKSFAAQLGILVDRQELQQAADRFRMTGKLHLIEETRLWMQEHFLSADDFEQLIYTNTLSEKLVEHLFADRVESFFEEHKFDYAEIVMYEILLEDNDLATELYYTLKMGKARFHDLARRYIQEPILRRCCGYKGIVYGNQLHPDIHEALLAAKPPQLLKPIVTAKGVHLILVEEIIRPKLDERLRARIMSDLFSAWLDREIAQTEIKTYFQNDELQEIANTAQKNVDAKSSTAIFR
ncbi:MAG: peptidylprolyl isomerase [Xenococcaceae cyanobacterium]